MVIFRQKVNSVVVNIMGPLNPKNVLKGSSLFLKNERAIDNKLLKSRKRITNSSVRSGSYMRDFKKLNNRMQLYSDVQKKLEQEERSMKFIEWQKRENLNFKYSSSMNIESKSPKHNEKDIKNEFVAFKRKLKKGYKMGTGLRYKSKILNDSDYEELSDWE